MRTLAISLLLFAAVATPVASQQMVSADTGRVRTPSFPGGPVTLGNQTINLSAKGQGCRFGPGDGWFVKHMAAHAYFAGCWTQQGHIIKIDTYVVVHNGMAIESIKHDVVDVPDRFYKQ